MTSTVTITAPSGGIAAGSYSVELTGLMPPSTGSGEVKLVSSIKSQSSDGNPIEAINDTDTGTCTISAAVSAGTTIVNESHAYPNSAGAEADF